MKGDLVGRVVERLHGENIRVIGRFDFSKLNESIACEHPEWLSRDQQGEPYPPYNGQVPTCLNGGYQQEAMFRILGEALDRYPLDGVFFNMIGYPRSDYSGQHLGICQCDACRRRFHEMYQLPLPTREAAGDPATPKYQEFCRRTISDQFTRVNQFIKGKGEGIAVCTYTAEGVDVIRSAFQMGHLRRLMESLPDPLNRIPDQSLLADQPGIGTRHIAVTRDARGRYALAYSPSGNPFPLRLDGLAGERLRAAWFDPREGTCRVFSGIACSGTLEFTPPTEGEGQDWVLVLNDASRNFPLLSALGKP
jgi:hypothetical protein